ncbi:MAG: hypothetical protein M1275_01955 [Patescibacteria group bacterium]|nr:hypothetical protein [Patescibacteria group bacterium]
MNKGKLATLLALVVILVIALGAYFYLKHEPAQETAKESATTTLVGGDRDEHGCIGSAGYSWCEPKNKCLRVWEESCYANPEEEIQHLLALKYNKPISEITVTATKKTDDYIAGRVSFFAPGLPQPGEGGIFLAAKKNNVWTLVYDGNGSIDCPAIKQQYAFPTGMLQGFCD